jgi:TonB family protein
VLHFSVPIAKRGLRVMATKLRGGRVAAVIAGILAAQSVCFAANPQAWIELQSPHFVVVTNANEHEARTVAVQFETIRAVLQEHFGNVSTNDQAVIIIAAKDEATLKPLLPESWTKKGSAHRAGLFLNGPDKSYVGLRLDVSMNQSAYEPYEPIYHEYVHYRMRRIIPLLPVWMVEGLAEFYANIRIESNQVLLGTPSISNLMILGQKTLLPLNTLFEVNASSPYYNEENKVSIFYAESWALTHYLVVRDWREKTHLVNDFVALLRQNVPQTEAAQRTIGDPRALEKALSEYIHKFTFTEARLDRPKIEAADFQARPLSNAESLAVRADFMAHEGRYAEAQAMLEESLKLDPKLAAAYESMGFLYLQQGRTRDAEKWSAQALTLNPQSYRANYAYAWSLLRGGALDDDTVGKAEGSLRAVIKNNPEFVPAYDALADCLARPGAHQNLDEAQRMALTAVDREPGNVYYRIRAVEVLERMGRAEDAIRVATLAASMAKTPQEQGATSASLAGARQFQVSQRDMKELQEAQASSELSSKTGSPEHKEPTPGAQAGGVEILSDTMGVDFNPYLKRILQNVNEQWHPLLPASVFPPIRKSGTVAIEFAILKDGKVAGMRLAGSSGDPQLDRASWGGITNSVPFPPLPQEFKGQYLQLRFIYCYNDACNQFSRPRNPALENPIHDIRRKLAENLYNDKNAKTDLENDVTALTKLLDTGNLDSIDDGGARYYRAAAQSRLDGLRKKEGLPSDTATAKRALNDLDRIIAGKSDITGWGVTIPNVEYEAGFIAWNELHSDSRAYSYWQRCADSAYAGCMFKLSVAYIGGLGGMQPDPAKALDLSLKVFDTGTTYTCSGANAASLIAALIYFTGATNSKDNDPVSWTQKSYGLSHQIEARPNGKGSCAAAGARVEEFLYRLARGERQNDLLGQATQHLDDDSPAFAALINYFSGSIDEKALVDKVDSTKSEWARCDSYFHAFWYADLTKNTALAKKSYDELSHLDQFSCATSLVFAKKFHH